MSFADPSSELAAVSLGDRRLDRRARRVIATIARRPAAGFPVIFETDSELEAFYRLVNNPAVSPDALLAPHSAESWRRAATAGEEVLVLHDTSEFTYAGESPREGLARKKESQCFHGHFALAVAEGEAPRVHGVVGNRSYVVEDGTWYEAVDGEEFAALLVGSERWGDLVEDVGAACPPSLHRIHVMDREADDYTLWTRIIEQGDHFVIRSQHDRVVADSATRLFRALEGEPFVVSREVTLSRRDNRRPPGTRKTHPAREGRAAKLSVRAGRVEVVRPVAVAPLGTATLTLSVVEVLEIDPPDEVTPVHWLLLSTLPIQTAEDVLRIVDIYRKRWLIEEFFKALKTGCSAEKRQGRSLWSLLNTVTLLIPIAWRLLDVRTASRMEPNAPASRIVDEVELQALRHLSSRVKLARRPTSREVMLAIAGVGGHLKANGEPGWLVLYRGVQRLLEFVSGWRAAMEFMAERRGAEM